MSISGNDFRFRKSSNVNGSIISPLTDYWTRPSDWLAMPAISGSEQKIVGLLAVFDAPNNFVSVQCSGNYTVDWGDGTSPQNYSSTVQADYNYTYSSISSTTNSSRGYRQVIITITPQAGQNLTSVRLARTHPSQDTNNFTTTNWLDLRMRLPNATTLEFNQGSAQSSARCNLVENIEVIDSNVNMFYRFAYLSALENVYFKSSATLLDSRNAFFNCVALKNISLDVTIGVGCDGGNMFSGCRSLRKSPSMRFASTGYFWNVSNHFLNCSLLEKVFVYPNTASTTIFTSMFQGCSLLQTAPYMITTGATAMDSMFRDCVSLKSVPLYDLNGVTNIANMFQNCRSLETVPNFDFSTITTTGLSSTFAGCSSLIEIPSNLANITITSLSSTFDGCSRITKVPFFTTNTATSFSSAFGNCPNLISIPAYNATAVTSFATISATSLQELNMININATCSWPGGTQLQKTQMETVFNNLVRTTTAKTVTISTSPAAVTYSKTGSSTTSGSANVTVGNNTSLTVGMYATNANLGTTKAVTFQDTGDTVTLTAHGFAADKAVAFSVITTTTGISTYTTYYVINPTTDTFQLASSPGGSALPLTTDGSGTILIVYKVTNIAGTTITLDAPATATASSQTIVFRNLNVSLATFKGWTVSG